MRPLSLTASRAVALLLACGGVTACGSSSIPRPSFVAQPTRALVAIPHEPPPARVEHAPPRPLEAAVVWIDGEWAWHDHKWWWSPGRWLVPPEGALYAPWCTVRAPDGTLYFAPAAWRDKKGGDLPPPKALATAVVDSGVVVDAAGDMERTMVQTAK
jgi:hypothetical protein